MTGNETLVPVDTPSLGVNTGMTARQLIAKDVLCALIARNQSVLYNGGTGIINADLCEVALLFTDKLIEIL